MIRVERVTLLALSVVAMVVLLGKRLTVLRAEIAESEIAGAAVVVEMTGVGPVLHHPAALRARVRVDRVGTRRESAVCFVCCVRGVWCVNR